VAPLEPWEKALVDGEAFLATVHGKISCQACHQGEQSPDKETAHTGLVAYPSDDPETYCGDCHPNLTTAAENSLHGTLDGYWTILSERGVPQNHPPAEEMFGNHCAGCHASCGDCHVSRPTSVAGGFIDGHIFNAEPSMINNCTACHGSRVGNEFLGKHEDLKADVHYREGKMTCVDCHTGHEMHGQPANCQDCHQGPEASQVAPPEHRYDGLQSPSCESCHPAVAAGNDGLFMHEQHSAGTLSCQVCHSVSYTNCDGCHVSLSEETGNPLFTTEGSYLSFYIGKNPIRSYSRPYDYVPVRHVPISPTSFDYYEEGMVSKFSARETWVYATPHNIQRFTPQTKSCGGCHGNPDIFLTADNVAPGELEANREVIVDVIPPLPY
jgi:thiosulfate/3-mercaptopyruvate sulfurtransferase